MADEIIKIQELPETNTIGDSDVLPIVQGGVTYKIPVSVMRNDVAESTVENVEYVDGTLTVTKNGTETDLFNAEELKTDLDLTKADVGLGNVDNTSDLAKPISTATQAALNTKQNALTFDDAPVSGSSNPVKSSGIYTALAGKKNTQTAKTSPSAAGNSLSFIDTISQDTQGVITATKKNVTVDSVPTEGSNNPVKSGGVYSAVSDLNQALTNITDRTNAITASKNKLDLTNAKQQTIAGVTFTPHFTDGFLDYILVNGTATARADYDVPTKIKAGTYYISSFVDDSGHSVPYTNVLTEYYNSDAGFDIRVNNENVKTGTINDEIALTCRVQVLNGNTVNNVKVYPMFRLTTETDSKYVPYGYAPNINEKFNSYDEDIDALEADVSRIDANTSLPPSTKNKLNVNSASVQTISGITFTPHFTRGYLDYILVNGTATARADYDVLSEDDIEVGTYKASAYSDESGEQVAHEGVSRVEYYNNTSGDGIFIADTERDLSITANEKITMRIQVLSGNTVDNVKVYPMIRNALDRDGAYVPYDYTDTVETALEKTNNRIDRIIEDGTTSIVFDADPKVPYWVFHLDCGRKYISVANIKTMLDSMADAGMNQIQLHFSDDQGFRLGLTDMTFEDEDGTVYDLTQCLGGTESPTKWYSQADLDEIISYANGKGINVVPSVDMPGHMSWILNYYPQFKYGNTNSLDISNSTAVKFCKALVNKYTKFFFSRNCKIWNFGFDEFGGGSGLSNYYTNNEFDKVTDFANGIINVIKSNGMKARMYRDAVYYQNDYRYYIEKDVEVCYWGVQYQTQPSPDKLMRMGYKTINMSSHYYWVLGSPSYHVNVTPEYLRSVQNLLTDFVVASTLNGYGAVLSIWCDLATSVDVGDEGASIVTAAVPLIEAFGDAIENTLSNN